MIAVFDPAQRAHDPQFFLSSGAAKPCPEKPSRIEALLSLGMPHFVDRKSVV